MVQNIPNLSFLSVNLQVWYPVTPGMGKPSFDGPECIKEVRLVGFFFNVMYFLSSLA